MCPLLAPSLVGEEGNRQSGRSDYDNEDHCGD